MLLMSRRRAFTLIELIAVIVILAIISVVAVPKFFDHSAKAKEAACKGTLGGVRSAISNFYANQAVNGSARYPTLAEVQTADTVMMEVVPVNPYNGSATIVGVSWTAGNPTSGAAGWNYDATTGKFWANSDTSGINENDF
jgi:prepilin-type N-terminal cleavage/methylation domain-containing protein